MRHSSNASLLIAFVALSLAAGAAAGRGQEPAPGGGDAPASVEGVWQGMLRLEGGELRLIFILERAADGGLTGSINSPDQAMAGIPLSQVEVEGTGVRFAAAAIAGEFEGRLAEDGDSIAGVWRQSGLELPVRLTRTARAPATPQRPQEPPERVPYRVEEVAYDSLDQGVRLAGTLTVPAGEGPFPAVLLITGSGPQDRDETLLGHRPFAVLADHLTLNGIAVLRVDDRGVGESTGDFTAATSEDFADDAEAGFRWLRARPEVDRARVGLLGHSEGAIVAPLVAAREPAVAFLVLLAAPAVPGEQILYRQGELILRAGGAGDEVVEASRTLQEALFRAVRDAADGAAAQAAARAVLLRRAKTLEGPEREQAEAMFDLQAAEVASPWFRFFLRHDPAPVLAKVRCPVLAVWGEKDLQVPPDQNRPPLEAALAAGGNRSVAARVLPGLNHLLQPAMTGHPGEYGQIEETIDTVALQLIVFWIQDAVGAVPQPPPK